MPRVDPDKRARLEVVSETFSRIVLRFGFMETPNVPQALAIARKLGWHFDIMSTTFFLSRRTLRPAETSTMPRWQDQLFITLARSANDATDYFQVPTERVVEVGLRSRCNRWIHDPAPPQPAIFLKGRDARRCDLTS